MLWVDDDFAGGGAVISHETRTRIMDEIDAALKIANAADAVQFECVTLPTRAVLDILALAVAAMDAVAAHSQEEK